MKSAEEITSKDVLLSQKFLENLGGGHIHGRIPRNVLAKLENRTEQLRLE